MLVPGRVYCRFKAKKKISYLRSNFGHKTDADGSNKGEFDEIPSHFCNQNERN